MINIYEINRFTTSLGVEKKSIIDLTNFIYFIISPKNYRLYVVNDQHIYTKSATNQSIHQIFFGKSSLNPDDEIKQIHESAQRAFREIKTKASQTRETKEKALKILNQLKEEVVGAPESRSKILLIQLIQETHMEWAAALPPPLISRKLKTSALSPTSGMGQLVKQSFQLLKANHTTEAALALAVHPYASFSNTIKKMAEKEPQRAACEVAAFYEAINELSNIELLDKTKCLIQNSLKAYAFSAENALKRCPGGEEALQTAFANKRRPSDEIVIPSQSQS